MEEGLRKTITVVVPTYNEEKNISTVYSRVKAVFDAHLPGYGWKLLFIDNFSTDSSREKITELCGKDKNVQAIFNGKNYGFTRSSFYGLLQAEGDAAILMYADLQDPPEVIPSFVREWEKGHTVVCGQKTGCKEPAIKRFCRKFYYGMQAKISEYGHIDQYNGFGLYDASFLEVLRSIEDPMPYLRGMVAELAPNVQLVPYQQEERKAGKSKFKLYKLIDYSLTGITSTSKLAMRFATIIGLALAVICLLIAISTVVVKLVYWDSFPMGSAAIIVGIFFLGSIQLIFIGLLGEYVTSINIRVMNKPLIVEEKRMNFSGK